MKNSVPALSPLLRSNAQGDILAAILVDDDAEQSIADLSRRTGVTSAQVHREIVRLEQGGIILSRFVGRARLIKANPAYRHLAAVRELVLASYGPRTVIATRLSEISGVHEAYLYGSWAARYLGEPGPDPQDFDVLVIGDTPRRQLESIGSALGTALQREVNIERVTAEEWSSPQTPFIRTLKQRPLVPIYLSVEEGTTI